MPSRAGIYASEVRSFGFGEASLEPDISAGLRFPGLADTRVSMGEVWGAERWPSVQRTCMEWGGAALAEVAVGLPLL